MTVKLPCIRHISAIVFVLLNNHQYNCNITKYFLSVVCFVVKKRYYISFHGGKHMKKGLSIQAYGVFTRRICF